jgi:hypothetical protein
MRTEYQLIELSNSVRTNRWINNWAFLGYEVADIKVVTDMFGKVKKYIVLMVKETE